MFRHKFVLFACTLSPLLSSPQSYFHTTHGNGGSFTSISHGSGALPSSPAQPQHHAQHHAQARAYQAPAQARAYHAPAPAPFVHHAAQPVAAYHAPAPLQHGVAAYHAPVVAAYHAPVVAAYHAPAVAAYHGPHAVAAAPNYGEKCALDYEEQAGEVCVPVLETKCDHEDGGDGVELHEEEDCHDVVRTVCVERHTVVDNEVCAYSYSLKPVDTEAQLVEATWEHVCHQETICLNPQHIQPAYGAPAPYCHEEIHETCHLEPTLIPLIKPVTIQLPQPVEVCINKQVVLPHIDCHKVKDRHCMVVPKAEKGHPYQIDKCDIVLGEPSCQEVPLRLPRQVCQQKIDIVKTVYSTEEVSYY